MLKHNISISLRLTAWFGSIFFLGWLLFGTAMGFNLNRTLTGERRQTLDRRLDRLQDLLRAGTTESEADRAQDFKDFARATGNGLAEIFTPDGRHVYPSPSNNAANFPWPDVPLDHKEAFLPIDFAGQPYWVMSRPVELGSQQVILLVAAPGTGNRVVLDNFWRGLMASVPILLLISSMGGYWISRRALKPVDQITSTARSIGIRNLSERLPVTDSSDELQRLAETCNEMLERIESAVKRLKQFTADASHELRGPLSLTRTVAEVALRNPGADELSREAFRDIVEESVKASELLDQMLLLARADAEQVGIEMSAVDLGSVLQEAYGMAEKIAEEKGLELTLSSPEHANFEVMGSFSSLRRLLWIVLDNALKYTNTPGRVCVSLCAEELHAVVRISDTGISISDADLPYIFDRFYRADPSRSKVEGNGLGLSIAKWIADVHHAEMLVSTKAGAGTLFTIRLPLLTQVS